MTEEIYDPMDQLKYPCFLAASIFLSVLEEINARWLDYNVVMVCFDLGGVSFNSYASYVFVLSRCLNKKRMSFDEVE